MFHFEGSDYRKTKKTSEKVAPERTRLTIKMKGHKDPAMLIYFTYLILASKGYYSILFTSDTIYKF